MRPLESSRGRAERSLRLSSVPGPLRSSISPLGTCFRTWSAPRLVVPQNVSRTPRDLEFQIWDAEAGLRWQFDAPVALREYARFVEDAVLRR
jgi:hypothetical protein